MRGVEGREDGENGEGGKEAQQEEKQEEEEVGGKGWQDRSSPCHHSPQHSSLRGSSFFY